MPTIGSALTIFHEGGSPEMATRDGVSTGNPGAILSAPRNLYRQLDQQFDYARKSASK